MSALRIMIAPEVMEQLSKLKGDELKKAVRQLCVDDAKEYDQFAQHHFPFPGNSPMSRMEYANLQTYLITKLGLNDPEIAKQFFVASLSAVPTP